MLTQGLCLPARNQSLLSVWTGSPSFVRLCILEILTFKCKYFFLWSLSPVSLSRFSLLGCRNTWVLWHSSLATSTALFFILIVILLLCIFRVCFHRALVAQTAKHLPTVRQTWVQSLGWEDLLEKEMAIHPSILAWKIPWREESGGL